MGLIGNIANSLEMAAVDAENRARRNVRRLASAPAEELLASNGSALLSCGDEGMLARIVAGRATAYAENGWPTVIIHEGSDAIVAAARGWATASGMRVAEVDGSSRFYEPLRGLGSRAAASLLYRSASGKRKAPDELLPYLEMLTRLMELGGSPMCTRVLQRCPHASIFQVISDAEASGAVSDSEAAGMRAVAGASSQGQVAAQSLLLDIVNEGRVLPERRNLPTACSLASFACSAQDAVLSIDAGAHAGRSLVSIVLTEAEDLVREGCPVQLILAVESLDGGIAERLAREPSMLGWCIASREMGILLASQDSLSQLAAHSGRVVTFRQGIRSAEMLSALFGEYERRDAVPVHGGYGLRNPFGSSSVSIGRKRERVVQPEQIRALRHSEFLMIDGSEGTVMGGQAR